MSSTQNWNALPWFTHGRPATVGNSPSGANSARATTITAGTAGKVLLTTGGHAPVPCCRCGSGSGICSDFATAGTTYGHQAVDIRRARAQLAAVTGTERHIAGTETALGTKGATSFMR